MPDVYQKLSEKYPLQEALELSVACDRVHGFLRPRLKDRKRGAGKNAEPSNRTLVLRALRARRCQSMDDTLVVTPADIEKAAEIYEHFYQTVVLNAVSDNLYEKRIDGTVNSFNKKLDTVFRNKTVGLDYEMAIVASLPNSMRVEQRRQIMADFRHECGKNGYIGDIGRTMKIKGTLMDVRFVKAHKLYVVYVKTDRGNIAKFILIERPDVVSSLERAIDQEISFVGKVSKHENNNYFVDSQETLFNSVTHILTSET